MTTVALYFGSIYSYIVPSQKRSIIFLIFYKQTSIYSNDFFLSKGLMFGYATDETEECMPLTVDLAHRLNYRIAELRRSGEFWWARPDSKTQVNNLAS